VNLVDFLRLPSNNRKSDNGASEEFGRDRTVDTEETVETQQSPTGSRDLAAAKCSFDLCEAHSLVKIDRGTIDCETYGTYIFSYVFQSMYDAVMEHHSLQTIRFFDTDQSIFEGVEGETPYTISCGIGGYLEVVIENGDFDDACEEVRDEINKIWGQKITKPAVLAAIVYEFENDYREMGYDVDLSSRGPEGYYCSTAAIEEEYVEPNPDIATPRPTSSPTEAPSSSTDAPSASSAPTGYGEVMY